MLVWFLHVQGLERDDAHQTCEVLLEFEETHAQVGAGQARAGRETLRRAAGLACRLAAPQIIARAALASGGLVLSTEVGIDDPDLVGMLEEGLAAVPAEDSTPRVRLLVRLGLALTWTQAFDRTAGFIHQAVAAARRLGDPSTLGCALRGERFAKDVIPAVRSTRGRRRGISVIDCPRAISL